MPACGVAFLLNTGKEQERGGVAMAIFYLRVYPIWIRRCLNELTLGGFMRLPHHITLPQNYSSSEYKISVSVNQPLRCHAAGYCSKSIGRTVARGAFCGSLRPPREGPR